jgi:N-acetylglucosaminyl-diphospho-decaprenol L-rhamnosyltransferase
LTLSLGIVIVHYNTPADLARCLASLRDEAATCPHEIVVVDNASTEPGLDEVIAQHPEVRWLRNTDNRGYSRGCNQGMAALPADYHLILNPDIVVLPGSLQSLLEFAERHPRAGLIGPQLLNEDGSIQESCRRFYTLKTLLLRRTLLGKLFPRSQTVARHLMRDFDHATPRPVDWVLGGCLLVRREALQRCGPMDERYFLYFEDVDWCFRMWQSGFEVLYHPDARFVHRHRRASARGALHRSFWLHLGSMIAFYEKWSLLVYAAKKWRRPLAVGLHWLLDMALLAVALLGAYGLRGLLQPLFPEDLLPLRWYGGWFGYAAILVTVAFVLMGRYRHGHTRDAPAWGQHGKQMGLVALLLLAGSYLGREEVVSRAVLLMLLVLYTGLTVWASSLIDRLSRRLEAGYLALERTLLAGPLAALAGWLETAAPPRRDGVDLVGYVTDDPPPASGHPALGRGDVPWLGTLAALPDLVDRFRVSQVVFWQQPGLLAEHGRVLGRLRRLRIRLRWVLADAWLLASGARPESFGEAPSGVLDPDDGSTLRQLAWRPLEIALAVPLLVIAGTLSLPRRRRCERGQWREEWVDAGDDPDDHGKIAVITDAAGRPLPLWWQRGLVWALLRGRLALVGRPLTRAADGPVRADAATGSWLREAGSLRAGLTGPRTGSAAAATGFAADSRSALSLLFLNPGGLAAMVQDAGPDLARPGGQEVDTT